MGNATYDYKRTSTNYPAVLPPLLAVVVGFRLVCVCSPCLPSLLSCVAGELPAEVDMLSRRWHACLHASVRGAGCRRVSVAVRSLLELEGGVSFALLFASPTTNPVTAEAVFFF